MHEQVMKQLARLHGPGWKPLSAPRTIHKVHGGDTVALHEESAEILANLPSCERIFFYDRFGTARTEGAGAFSRIRFAAREEWHLNYKAITAHTAALAEDQHHSVFCMHVAAVIENPYETERDRQSRIEWSSNPKLTFVDHDAFSETSFPPLRKGSSYLRLANFLAALKTDAQMKRYKTEPAQSAVR